MSAMLRVIAPDGRAAGQSECLSGSAITDGVRCMLRAMTCGQPSAQSANHNCGAFGDMSCSQGALDRNGERASA